MLCSNDDGSGSRTLTHALTLTLAHALALALTHALTHTHALAHTFLKPTYTHHSFFSQK